MNKKSANYCQQIHETKYQLSVLNNELRFPLIQSDDNSEWQLKLRIINTQNQLVQFASLSQVQQYLISDNDIKCIEIETIQKSKLGKLYKNKGNVIIDQGKNIGKKNQTTKLQQSLLFCDNKYEKMYNKKNKQCSIPHLMLLQTYKYKQVLECSCLLDCSHKNKKDDRQIDSLSKQHNQKTANNKAIKTLKFPQYIQRKYDGLRCCCIMKNTENQDIKEDLEETKETSDNQIRNQCLLYSRGQKEFTNLNHIKLQAKSLLEYYYKKHGTSYQIMLDGEIYVQGVNLQEINGIVKNISKDSQQSNLYIFDVDIVDQTTNKQVQLGFKDRLDILNQLQEIIQQMNIQHIQIVQTFIANDNQQIESFLQQFLDEGNEGLVLRAPNSLYCYSINNKRSNDTMKYKPRFDTEVNIIDISEGIGKDSGAIIWICKYQDQILNVVSNEQLNIRKIQFETISKNPQLLDILKKIPYEIQYSNMSNDNIPQQPRGIRFRFEQAKNDENEISDEIFKQLQQISIV